MKSAGKWFEVVNGARDIDYDQRMMSTLGRSFGVFYYKKNGTMHVYLNTNSRPSFIKEAVDIDPIDSLPKVNNSYISRKILDPYYYEEHEESGLDLKGLGRFISNLENNQGIIIWLSHYGVKPDNSEYSIKDDKFKIKIILIEKTHRKQDIKPKNIHDFVGPENTENNILQQFHDCINVEFKWKYVKKPTYKVFNPEGSFSFSEIFIKKEKRIYTYRANVPKLMIMEYSKKVELRLDNNGRGINNPEIAQKYLESKTFETGDNDINYDTKAAILMEVSKSDNVILFSGKKNDGKIDISKKLLTDVINNNRKLFVLETTIYDPYKKLITDGDTGVSRINLSNDYMNRIIVKNVDDVTLLAEKLWAEIIGAISSEKDPAILLYNVGDIVPKSDSGYPIYESEFWSSFFNLSSRRPVLILLLYDDDLSGKLNLYVDRVIKSYKEGNDVSFSIENVK